MSCKLWQDWLDTYVDEGCSPEENAGIEHHLSTCASCANEALARLRLKHATKAAAAGRYAPSSELMARMQQAIQNPDKPRFAIPFLAMLRHRIPPLTKQWKQGLVAAGTALVIAMIVWAALAARHNAREKALAQLLDLHLTAMASANPVDVASTDGHTVKPWFEGKLPYTFYLPELEGSPFKLLGGKLMYFRNSPGAQLLFEVRKHQISVFVLQEHPGSTPKSMGVATARQRGFSEETWGQGGLRYVIIGDTNAADVHALGDLLRAAARQ